MTVENTLRFERELPLSDTDTMELVWQLERRHGKGKRKDSINGGGFTYSFTYVDSNFDPLQGGTVHRYEGALYRFVPTVSVMDCGFSLIEAVDEMQN